MKKLTIILSVLLFILPTVAGEELRESTDSLVVSDLRAQGINFTHTNKVELLTSGQIKFDRLFEDIRNAHESIHMEYFNFRNDSIANALFDLLAEKVKQGVEVRCIFDAFGNTSNNQPLKKKHLKNLWDRGIQIYEFDPLRFPWVNHTLSRDHRKIVVIDGEIAYTGGMNVADYYIHGTEVVGEWNDMHCRLTGPEVNTLQCIFLGTWYEVTDEAIFGKKYYKAKAAGNTMVGIINRVPHASPKIIREFYLSAINNAKRNIRIVNPYFTLTPSLKRALKNAVKRGVKVEIMLSTKSDIPLTPAVGFYNAHKLMKEGCCIWMFEKGFHHTKVIMVDDEICSVGSANLDARSLQWDFEENAIIADKQITKQLTDRFEQQKHDSFLLTPETWKAFRTPAQRRTGWWGHLLTPFL